MGINLKKLFGGGGGGGGGFQAPAIDDPEKFYTPEMQQAILDALGQDAEEGRVQAQAGISGQAITSGFGVGNSSREATRRAKADANALDEIVNGYINQAAQIEDMRTQNRQTQKIREAGIEDFRVREREQASGDRQDMLTGGIGAISNIIGSKIGGMRGKPPDAGLPPSLSLFRPGYSTRYNDPNDEFTFAPRQ